MHLLQGLVRIRNDTETQEPECLERLKNIASPAQPWFGYCCYRNHSSAQPLSCNGGGASVSRTNYCYIRLATRGSVLCLKDSRGFCRV